MRPRKRPVPRPTEFHNGYVYVGFKRPLGVVSNHASIKPVLMAVQTLGTAGTGSQTNLILTRFDTKLGIF